MTAALLLPACGDGATPSTETGTGGETEDGTETQVETETETTTTGMTGEKPQLDVDGFANGCYHLRAGDTRLARNATGDGYEFASVEPGAAARFFLKASDLGTYLLYDEEGGYLVAEDAGGALLRQTSLQSDILLIDDSYVSGAEWLPETSSLDWAQYQLRNRRTDELLAASAVTADEQAAVAVTFEDAEGCEAHPELTLDASGEVGKTTFEDGDLYGIVDTHSHIMANFGFGGGGIFHGAPFHRLGPAHALPDCELYHGVNGRKDFFGFAYDTGGSSEADLTGVLPDLIAGELSADNHITTGYPDFTQWPAAPSSSTHQTQYYRWLERAHLAGLRLIIQHATTNSVICELNVGEGYQKVRYSCDDMVAVNRQIEETYALERYIDAQHGGPGQGWFRVVQSPAEAREVISGGKLAVVLGIETSELFGCRITPREGDPVCDEDYVREQLDQYYDLGVRVMFPVHKYDNRFSPGDGNRAFIELGNFLYSGHWGNFTDDCPGLSNGFDRGNVFFGGLNMPREDYLSPAPNDMSGFPDAPLTNAFPFIDEISAPPLEGEYCQNATLTDLGETLMNEMMARGIIIEIDHLPQRSYLRAFEMLEGADYPAAGTHGRTHDGQIYAIKGVSKTNLGRCRDPENPGSTLNSLLGRVAQIEEHGGYPAEGFGFDLNGFAGAPGPRFGEGKCGAPQEDPVTYPFRSYADDVEFTQPQVGNRELDFNTEGMVHIGLLPELIEDARGDAVSDADLEPLFRSAEAYIRMWERAEQRSAKLRGE